MIERATSFPFKEVNNAILATITPREELAIRWFYGLDMPKASVKEMSEYFHVGRNRVYQILDKAKRKMANRFSTDLGLPPPR